MEEDGGEVVLRKEKIRFWISGMSKWLYAHAEKPKKIS